MAAIVGQVFGGWQADKACRTAFTRGLGLDKVAVDERKGFISRGEPLAYHPKREDRQICLIT
jgi:hypothetical protein